MVWSSARFREESKKLLAKLERKLSLSYIIGINNIRDSVKQKEVVQALQAGQVSSVQNLVDRERVNASMADFKKDLRLAYVSGGELAENAGGIDIQFNPFDNVTSTFINAYVANKVVEITDDIQKTIGETALINVSNGVNPLVTAREIRGSIGLTTNQYKAVQRYRENLENLDSYALERKLRDKRFDSTVSRAIQNDTPLSKEQINKMVKRYEQRYIKYRSETIARTESTRLTNQGDSEYWQQVEKDGRIPSQALRSFWIYTKDGKARETHSTIPSLNPDGVPFNTEFRTLVGAVKRPGTFPVAGENINCRCRLFTRIITSKL